MIHWNIYQPMEPKTANTVIRALFDKYQIEWIEVTVTAWRHSSYIKNPIERGWYHYGATNLSTVPDIAILNIKLKEEMNKTVTLTLETAKHMYKTWDEGIRKFVLENYPELDRVAWWTVIEWEPRYINDVQVYKSTPVRCSKAQAIASDALAKLMYLASQAWMDERKQEGYSIIISPSNELKVCGNMFNRWPFHFSTFTQAENFMKDNKELFHLAAPLL